ncbi:hypothetical protein F5884DRAFT_892792 [Xylogone sp. PMI_703]|nr:hypothetical protein F5884DRAFT_892792 [Xylogone sp. PMI_703]
MQFKTIILSVALVAVGVNAAPVPQVDGVGNVLKDVTTTLTDVVKLLTNILGQITGGIAGANRTPNDSFSPLS